MKTKQLIIAGTFLAVAFTYAIPFTAGAQTGDDLIAAVTYQDLDKVKELVKAGVDVNFREPSRYGNTPLVMACQYNLVEIAKYLMENGAEINLKTSLERKNAGIREMKWYSVPANPVFLSFRRPANGEDRRTEAKSKPQETPFEKRGQPEILRMQPKPGQGESENRSFFWKTLPFFIIAHAAHHFLTALPQPLLPAIRDEFNLNYRRAAFVPTAFAVSGATAQLPAGWLADRIGPKLLIAVGMIAMGDGGTGWRLVPLLCGLALIALAYLLAVSAFRSRVAGLYAAAFIAASGFVLAFSKTALLDGMLATSMTAAALAVWRARSWAGVVFAAVLIGLSASIITSITTCPRTYSGSFYSAVSRRRSRTQKLDSQSSP